LRAKNGKDNQSWSIVYVDEAEDEQEKGLNKEFGMIIGKPFVLRSRMLFHRVVENHPNTWNYLRRYVPNRKGQQWFFDGASKTIKNGWRTTWSMQIHSNGGHPYSSTALTNSRWW
jgi:hypothetical protein